MMNYNEQEQSRQLFHLYYTGKATDAELTELTELLKRASDEELFQLLKNTWDNEKGETLFTPVRSEAIFNSILGQQQSTVKVEPPIKKHANLFTLKRLAGAAIITGVLLASYLLLFPDTDINKNRSEVSHEQQDILPGREGAVLTLADGRKILLDSAGNGSITSQGSIQVIKQGGQLRYEGNENGNIVFNTMSTPRGRQYSLVLEDGSKAWLNASSSITYPTAFTGNERLVEITGEAYFEIAHDAKKPFRVKLHEGSVVEVLGTNFNINSYTDERTIRTTLLQGIVTVRKDKVKLRLSPGQQAQVSNGDLKLEREVDLGEVMAWKNGLFSFNNTDLKTILRQLSRWYDIDIIYEGNIPSVSFSGEIGKSLSLTQVLSILDETRIHYKIEGRKLLITP
jgi:transmembrane sensor